MFVLSKSRLNNYQGWITVSNSTPSYSGNYSCVPSYTTPDWVMVHIIIGNRGKQYLIDEKKNL